MLLAARDVVGGIEWVKENAADPAAVATPVLILIHVSTGINLIVRVMALLKWLC